MAVGVPGAASSAGSVAVLTFLSDATTKDAHVLTQGTNGVPDTSISGDAFGSALAFGYFVDGATSGYIQDLIVGTPGQNASAGAAITVSDAGSVGPYTGHAWSQNSTGVDDTAEAGDRFGASLAFLMNAFTGERYLAIGAPKEDVGTVKDAGMVNRFRYPGALNGSQEVGIVQGAKGVAGSAEAGDQFGYAVSYEEFQIDTQQSGLAVGAPFEDVGTVKDAGGAGFYSVSGDPGANDTFLTESSAGVPGTAQTGDHMGAAVGGSSAGLLVGAPDDAGYYRGVVLALPWTLATGLSSSGGVAWIPTAGDRYGVAIG